MAEQLISRAGFSGGGVHFTVIICTYNYAHLLPDALRTLAAQTFQDYELLIVDDGSTDNTEEVVQQYFSRFRDCVYLKKPHTSLADTRNFAMAEAKGEYLAFLDSDDLWSPRYLETVQNGLESSRQAELIFCDGQRILVDGSVLRPVFPPDLPALDGPINSAGDLLSLCTHYLPSGMVFRRSLYERVGRFDTRFDQGLGDDVDWVIRAIMAGAYCLRIDQKLLLHRFHGANLTSKPISFLDAWLRIYEERLRNSRLGPECERRARRFARNYVLRLLGNCSPAEGRTLLARTIDTLRGDLLLRCTYYSTFLGSSHVIRPLRWAKCLLLKRHACMQKVDLTAPPEIIFQSL